MAGVVTLIKEDHQKLEGVFKKLEAGNGDTKLLLHQVAELLIPHSKAEEEVVYPAIKKIVPSESEDVDDGLAEHHHVEEVLKQLLVTDPDEPGADGLLAAMIGEVRHHVEEEEQEILPQLVKEATNQQLAELGEQFEQHKQKALADMS